MCYMTFTLGRDIFFVKFTSICAHLIDNFSDKGLEVNQLSQYFKIREMDSKDLFNLKEGVCMCVWVCVN